MESHDRRDVFLYRLVASIVAGLALITLVYSAHLWLQRIPATWGLLKDFGSQPPKITVFVMEAPWLPSMVALLALAAGVAAIAVPRRPIMVLASAGMLFALAVTLLAEYALRLPVSQLQQAISGG